MSVSAFPTVISLSSIIREMPQDYNSYIQAFREKDAIHGHEVRNCLEKMLFVTPGCHPSLSPLVVAPPCRFDRRGEKTENLMSTLPSLPVGWVPGSHFERL
jgi:hypothetical protein